MERRKFFVYLKDLGGALIKHDDVSNMYGWFQKLLKSRVSLSAQHDKEAKVTKAQVSSVNSVPTSPSSASSSGKTPSESLQSQSALSSTLRWSRKYDVFVCHSSSDSDSEEAGRLVSFLEASPHSLRCFLQQRDDCPGGAVSSELCQAVQNSHIWALLITPNFLMDEWCKYMMHQALAEGPMSNRIVPLAHNLPLSQYPQELKFLIFIDLNRNPGIKGYKILNETVLKYLEVLTEKEKKFAPTCNTDSSISGLSGEDSSKTDKPMPECDSTGTSIQLEVIKKRDGNLNVDCCYHQD